MTICMRCNAAWDEEDNKYGLCSACMEKIYGPAADIEENAANSTWTAMRLLSRKNGGGFMNSWTLAQVREEYERRYRVVLARFRAQAERAKALQDGSIVDAVFWHRGKLFSGAATRQPDGTWNFSGAQDRSFVGRKAAALTVTGMTRFSPRYQGKHTVEKTGGVAVVE